MPLHIKFAFINYEGTKEYRDRIARFFVGYLKERYFTYDKISAVKSAIDPP